MRRHCSSKASKSIKIGALFTKDERETQLDAAFKYAVYQINRDEHILPDITLMYDIDYISRFDSFHASKKVCSQVASGAISIFGPQDPLLGVHIQSLCDAVDIPHLDARYLNIGESETSKELSINLFPNPKVVSESLQSIVTYLNWTKVAVLYEDDMSLIGLQDLVKPSVSHRNVQYFFRKTGPENFRETLRDLKHRSIYSIIVDTKLESLPHFLTAILQVQMNDYKYHYHFTTFDIKIFDLENFKYNFVNMTAFRLIDSSNRNVESILQKMKKIQPASRSKWYRQNIIQTVPALIFDSVYVLAKALDAYQSSNSFLQIYASNASCHSESRWIDGISLFNYINSVKYHGLTGSIQFKNGVRVGIKLDLLKLRKHDLDKVGEWTSKDGLVITHPQAFHEFTHINITLRVTTIVTAPFVTYKRDKNKTIENLEGFCIDLLDAIAEALNFHYDLYLVPDDLYGSYNTTTGQWNGLVKELMDKRADLVVAPMTITYNRESVIDFTKPFMNLGIGILFKIPTHMPIRLFSFMSPLAVEIWLYVLAAYILVSSTLFIVARFTPYEWTNPHPCLSDSEIIHNQFSLADSFWFTVVTLMKQGCDLNPKAISTRIIGAIWWFFTIILISSYTANLAAFLTVERTITPIENVEDLAAQTKITYGMLEGGSTMTFFTDSKIATYQKMWSFMNNNRHVFVKDIEEGAQRVLDDDYAFLMESTMLDYMVQKECNLTQIGGLLDSKGYGIATSKGSPWRDKISLTILDLQEKGVIQMLYDKWWKIPGLTCMRDELKSKEGKASALGLDNIGGVFVVLLLGLALALITAIFEFFWQSRKYSQNSRQSFCTGMCEEMRYAVKCRASRKRPALRRQCSKCMIGSTNVPTNMVIPLQQNSLHYGPVFDTTRSCVYDQQRSFVC